MFKFWLQQKATDGATEVDFQEKALEGSRSKINLRHIRCTPTVPPSRPQPCVHLTLKRTCNVVINELINEWPRKGRIEPSKSKLITSRSRNQRLIANRTEDEMHRNCYMHKFYLHFYIIFLLLTKPQANTWPQKPDIISFYGIRVEFVPQQQQSKHVCHNHMWRLTDFPITNVCTWLWTSVSVCVCVWGVFAYTDKYLHWESLRVCVCCGSVHFWILHNNLWFPAISPLWLSKTVTDSISQIEIHFEWSRTDSVLYALWLCYFGVLIWFQL